METILVVDDEKNYQLVLKTLLLKEGYEVVTTGDVDSALEVFKSSDIDLVLTDMKMPNKSGLDLLDEIKRLNENVPVIIMTAYGSIETAVEAMKKQAYDFITKPFENERLKITIEKALENYRLKKENISLRDELRKKFSFYNIVGKNEKMQKIFDIIEKVSLTKSSVLITGPSGTGKELIAKAIHYHSQRKDFPFVAVNCGAIPESLLESELFGHEKGAFTGAVATRKGRFELADGGTLFLDEIGEMSPPLQVKLLRVLQEMEFERVGGTRTIRVNVRIIAASNRDLKEEVQEGRFREDLFFRLNVIHIKVPPLKERLDDLPLLVSHFLNKFKAPDGPPKRLSQEVWKVFYTYPWPGNIRELENVIERAVVLSNGEEITLEDIPEELKGVRSSMAFNSLIPPPLPLPQLLDKIEEELIKWALERCNNVQSHAANLLGITKSLMQHKLKKYNLSP